MQRLLHKIYCIINKEREVHFKILHLLKHFLRFCTDADDRCDFCGAESEDAVHLFLNLIYSKMFWIDFEGLLCKYLDMNVYFSEKDVF